MSLKLISHNNDLKKLRDEGYDVEIKYNHLLVKNVPYVNSQKNIAFGTLITTLTLAGDVTTPPNDHVAHFAGEYPCNEDGSSNEKIRNQSPNRALGPDLTINHSFSAKPKTPTGLYLDYYDKMTTYVAILSGPAQAIDPTVTAKTFPVVEAQEQESPFKYIDTASSRAQITIIANKLEDQKIAIIGVGGTGSYVLDFVAKTPVKEIHLFDADLFLQHNAFRAPGAPSIEELRQKKNKAVYFAEIYSRMHRCVIAHPEELDKSNVEALSKMNFIFLCLDKGSPKKLIIEKLEAFGISYIDVGMGIYLTDGPYLGGVLKVTTSTPTKRDHVREKNRITLFDAEDHNEYNTNIQIADLNALNATMAVIKWKKIMGLYLDLESEHFCTYTIDGNVFANEDKIET